MSKKVIIAFCVIACFGIAGAIVLLANAKAAFAKRAPIVEVAVAQSGETDSDVMAQGVVAPVMTSNVSVLPKLAGQVTQVKVDVGDRVTQGQILATIDPTDESDALKQAVAAEQGAEANLALTVRPFLPEQIEQARQVVERDREKVAQGEAYLTLLHHGHPPLEITAANAKVESAQATLDQAKADLARNQQLYAKELVAKADLELSQTNVAVDQGTLDQAKADRDLLVAGTRPEEIQEAEDSLRASQADEKSDDAAYRLMLLGSRPEKIEAAAATVQDAKAAVDLDKTIVERQYVRAPISGVVIARNVNPGELTQSEWSDRTNNDHPLVLNMSTLFQIADDSTVEFRANVDQRFYHAVHLGQPCSITVEPEPGMTFTGKIVRMRPVINPDFDKSTSSAPDTPDLPLTFQIWARVANPEHHLVMGETGILSVSQKTPGVTIPQSALNAFASGKGVVYVERGGFVKATPVHYADVVDGQVRIVDGVSAGDHVVVSAPYQLADGMAVTTVSSDGTGTTPMM